MSDGRDIRRHQYDSINRVRELWIKIDGSALGTSLSTDGVLIGKEWCTAKDDGSNEITISFNESFDRAPEVIVEAYSDDTYVKKTTVSADELVLTQVKASDGSTAVADADLFIVLKVFENQELY